MIYNESVFYWCAGERLNLWFDAKISSFRFVPCLNVQCTSVSSGTGARLLKVCTVETYTNKIQNAYIDICWFFHSLTLLLSTSLSICMLCIALPLLFYFSKYSKRLRFVCSPKPIATLSRVCVHARWFFECMLWLPVFGLSLHKYSVCSLCLKDGALLFVILPERETTHYKYTILKFNDLRCAKNTKNKKSIRKRIFIF